MGNLSSLRTTAPDSAAGHVEEALAPRRVGKRRPIATGRVRTVGDGSLSISAPFARDVDFTCLGAADLHRLWSILALCDGEETSIRAQDLEALSGRRCRDMAQAVIPLAAGSVVHAPGNALHGVQLVREIVYVAGSRGGSYDAAAPSELMVHLDPRAVEALQATPALRLPAAAWRRVSGRLAVRLFLQAAGSLRIQSPEGLEIDLDETDIDVFAPDLARRTMAHFSGVYVAKALETLNAVEPPLFEWGCWPRRKGARTVGVTIYVRSTVWDGRKRPATIAAAQNRAQRAADRAWKKQRQERLAKERAERVAAKQARKAASRLL